MVYVLMVFVAVWKSKLTFLEKYQPIILDIHRSFHTTWFMLGATARLSSQIFLCWDFMLSMFFSVSELLMLSPFVELYLVARLSWLSLSRICPAGLSLRFHWALHCPERSFVQYPPRLQLLCICRGKLANYLVRLWKEAAFDTALGYHWFILLSLFQSRKLRSMRISSSSITRLYVNI